MPHGFDFIPELPKTATGKIQKYVLRGAREHRRAVILESAQHGRQALCERSDKNLPCHIW